MTQPEGNATRFSKSPHADATMAGDRAAIYHRETRKAITLNPTGTILWQSLDTPKTPDELVSVLRGHWPQVDPQVLRSDVQRFIEQLQGHDLLVSEL